MAYFRLVIQHPKPKVIGDGVLSVGKDGTAMFFRGEGNKLSDLAKEMSRVRLEIAGANGIMLSGIEGSNNKTLRYQEWWLSYLQQPKKEKIDENIL